MKAIGTISLAAILVGGAATGVFAQDAKPVRIGWSAWSDAEFVTKLAARIIKDELGYKVELMQTDVAPLYQGVSRGDLDAMMMAWLPQTHADYYGKIMCFESGPPGYGPQAAGRQRAPKTQWLNSSTFTGGKNDLAMRSGAPYDAPIIQDPTCRSLMLIV